MAVKLSYIIGDATNPVKQPAIITHYCNDLGKWGRGFVLSLSKKWPEPEKEYRKWYLKQNLFGLGSVQFVAVEDRIIIANLIGQHGASWDGKIPPIRYEAIEEGLETVYAKAASLSNRIEVEPCTVHMPRIGAVLAGGDWPTIEKIIQNTMTVDTYVYTLENQKDRWPTHYETLTYRRCP